MNGRVATTASKVESQSARSSRWLVTVGDLYEYVTAPKTATEAQVMAFLNDCLAAAEAAQTAYEAKRDDLYATGEATENQYRAMLATLSAAHEAAKEARRSARDEAERIAHAIHFGNQE